jgi:hypothetical protein
MAVDRANRPWRQIGFDALKRFIRLRPPPPDSAGFS